MDGQFKTTLAFDELDSTLSTIIWILQSTHLTLDF